MKYDLIVFIGRFQPFHNAHRQILRQAYTLTNNVCLIQGSAKRPRSLKNPFNSPAYTEALYEACERDFKSFWRCEVEDNYDDQKWCEAVQQAVESIEGYDSLGPNPKIGLIGCNKDETSYYLGMFPQWKTIEVDRIGDLSATQIRDLYFVEKPNMDFLRGVLPAPIWDHLDQEKNKDWHADIVRERRFIEAYKAQFSSLPYKPIFVTVDAVVIQSGHVLVVRRKEFPGQGLLALPGGFVDAEGDLSLEDAVIRELREETRLKVPDPVLRGNIQSTRVFDSKYRSSRGRTITNVFHICLPSKLNGDVLPLPPVKAGSDAKEAFWLELCKAKSEDFFEDHYQILRTYA